MMDRRQFALGLLATLAWQRPALANPAVQRQARALMGTRVAITVVHADAATRASALQAAWATMTALAAEMSRYRTDSAVSGLEKAAGGPPQRITPAMMAVLKAAQALTEETGGAFDVTVGAYRDWHFGTEARAELPSEATLRSQRGLVDPHGLRLDAEAGTAGLTRAGMRLDLGGIAKLPILEAGLLALQTHGVQDAMVDGGGDVLCRGQLLGRDWRVGVRDPRAPQRMLGVVALRDGIVAASGDYERGFELGGRRYHHVLDPATGMPSRGPQGVAMVARTVAEVNGLGTAIMVAGAEAGRRWLARRPNVDALIAGPQGLWRSAGMARRLNTAA